MTRRTGLRVGTPTSDAVVTVDPATGDEIACYSAFDDAEIEAALSAGHDAATRTGRPRRSPSGCHSSPHSPTRCAPAGTSSPP